ncbi:hypothetical protein D1627_13790 [Pontibacter oryzae]|uniref:DUF5050 domain-containing protein n=1 Tax=Pontibacter oryzae TaxID=2304593 RepID=A0A399S5J4_9BACT|nr:hypothetical protein D1627_13790 [Pontibacter oryzae]
MFILWLSLITQLSAHAQDTLQAPVLTYSHTLPVSSPTSISQDRNGYLYVLDNRLNLLRLNPLGHPVDTYSPQGRGRASSIHAWNPLKIVLFYESSQRLVLLDRFLRPVSSFDIIEISNQTISKLAAPAADIGYWLFNETTLTLSKFNPLARGTTIETPLNLILDQEQLDMRQLREYQNMVYLLDYNSGILVFDNLGNYKTRYTYPGVEYMGFKDNEVYFVKGNTLYFLDLYTQKERTITLPMRAKYNAALVGAHQLYLFSTKGMDVYTME